jgi:hypothetical protein
VLGGHRSQDVVHSSQATGRIEGASPALEDQDAAVNRRPRPER